MSNINNMTHALFDQKSELHARQDQMARNIGDLKSKTAKQAQVHMLCRSLVAMLRARSR